MNIPTKKLKSGFEMPVYGFGTWQIGGGISHDLNNDDKADIMAIQTAIDRGVTHIDTAEVYAGGHAETLVGEAIQNYDRKKLFLVSKVFVGNMRYNELLNACRQSLKRLQTDYLDLYLLHRYPGSLLKDALRAMDTLKKEGLIRTIGISNFIVQHMKQAQEMTENKIVATQVHLNLRVREAEQKGVLQYCQENDMMCIAWRPLQKGFILEKNELMNLMCQKYGKTPAQIALNWLISQDNVVTLSKTRDKKHLQENLGAIGWTMEKEDIELLRNDFPNQESLSDSVPLE